MIFNLRNCIIDVRYFYYGYEWAHISLLDPQKVFGMIPGVIRPYMSFLCDLEYVGVPIYGVETYSMEYLCKDELRPKYCGVPMMK